MNGMKRKVAKRSAALECYGEKRKPPAAGFGRKTIHVLHIKRVVGFLWFFPATMLIEKLLIGYRVRGVCAAIAHSVIL
jgi:hypothetical protein